ncbi:transcriptional regulator [Opitutaceae bacterium TAV5]|nr:transcriptional regulator [Opitutaceae bacterium TAV5]
MTEKDSSHHISIRDLAKIAGVSRTTVSLALRGSHEIGAGTRERIVALARQHDYRSHPAVNALMQQVGRKRRVHDEEIIAFIRTGQTPEETAPGPLEILEGAAQEAHRLGFRVEVFWAGYCGQHSERLARVLFQRGIRGVIWGPMPYPHPPLRFPWHQFVPIACTPSTEVPNLPAVLINHSKGMALALEELRRMGAGNTGVVLNYDMDHRQDFGWLLGTDLYRHRTGQENVHSLILKDNPDEKRLRRWIRQKGLDALIMMHDLYHATRYLENDIARASLDVARAELGKVGGLYQNMRLIGEHAVRSLASRLYSDIPGLPEQAFHMVVQASFVQGESLRNLEKAAGRKA